ncbi:hypothetical protein FVR03_10335 [Pontibacter qinzhouensis]|uniref:DUF1579 domain-containing protein n=1 Tax=Pontibacter qinzhouensis TaxID=2603253 RepID=A0A5C8K8I6_9BACT|nr:hypothetical protein [Pontibacter qinzhouensis]TXK46815.1 hypothetical protein FVR03_10335 [Pontibacter qinzhouensis]
MKKVKEILLTAILLACTVLAVQAQTLPRLSHADATYLLQRSLGSWQVSESVWQPTQKSVMTCAGKAVYKASDKDIAVHEHCEIQLPDGASDAHDGYLRYSTTNNQFEFVKEEAATGKAVKLFTGHWFPEFNTLLMFEVRPKGTKLFKKFRPQQWRYVFQNNGTFSKLVHQPDEHGNMLLMHKSNYTPLPIADAE